MQKKSENGSPAKSVSAQTPHKHRTNKKSARPAKCSSGTAGWPVGGRPAGLRKLTIIRYRQGRTSRKTQQDKQKDETGQAERRDIKSRRTRQDKQKGETGQAERCDRTSTTTRKDKQKDERGPTEK